MKSIEFEPKTTSREKILEAIKAEGFEVKERLEEVPSSEIIYDGFETISPKFTKIINERINTFSNTARGYLSGIIVVDSFGEEHSKRREWRVKMKEQHGTEFIDLYNTNKLRINRIAWVRLDLGSLVSGLDIFKVFSPKADRVRELYENFPEVDDYDKMDTEEKLKIVEKIDTICRSYLTLISSR